MAREDLEELSKDFGLSIEEFVDRYIKPTLETILKQEDRKLENPNAS